MADVWRSTKAGLRSGELTKRYTSISTANDQGKTSGVNAIGVIAAAFRQQGSAVDLDLGSIGTTTYRAPFTPVSFAALAGRQRGPVRPRPPHLYTHLARTTRCRIRGR